MANDVDIGLGIPPGAAAVITCRFRRPTCLSLGTRNHSCRSAKEASVRTTGSSSEETIASIQVCSAADGGTFQSHRSTFGVLGSNAGICWNGTRASTVFQKPGAVQSFGKLAQKSVGSTGRPAEASAHKTFTFI